MLRLLERTVDMARRARRWVYRAGLLESHGVEAPVISVGGRGLGGRGKTPVTGFLAQELSREGLKVAVLISGYGGAAAARPAQVLSGELGAAARHGDEAALMGFWLPEALVITGGDRLAAARLAVTLGAGVILVDDGYTHRRLARDLDLVLMDPDHDAPRVPVDSAALPWMHCRDGAAPPSLPGSWVSSRLRATGLRGMDGAMVGQPSDLKGARVYLVTGIARPDALERLVHRLGARVVGRTLGRDHRPLCARARGRAARLGADVLLCSEKDAARMAGQPGWTSLVALCCQVELCQGEAMLREALAALVPVMR